MTDRKIAILLEILTIAMQCVCFVCMAVIVYYGIMQYESSEFAKSMIICIPVITAYFLRKYINSFLVFYLFHLSFFAAALIYAQTVEETGYDIFLMGILIVWSGKEKARKTPADHKIRAAISIALITGCYLIGAYQKSEILMRSGLVLLIIFILLWLFYYNISKLKAEFVKNEGSANFPAMKLLKAELFMMVISTAVILGGMLAFYAAPHGKLVQILVKIFKGIADLVLKVLSIVNVIVGSEKKKNIHEEMGEAPVLSENHAGIIDTIFTVIFVVLIVVIAIAIIVEIVRAIKRIITSFGKNKVIGSDVVEFIRPDKKPEKIGRLSKKICVKEESEIDINMKLRKIYRKKVNKSMGHDKIAASTFPEEITRKAITQDENESKRITAIYEKARYSNEKVTTHEIEFIKTVQNKKVLDFSKDIVYNKF